MVKSSSSSSSKKKQVKGQKTLGSFFSSNSNNRNNKETENDDKDEQQDNKTRLADRLSAAVASPVVKKRKKQSENKDDDDKVAVDVEPPKRAKKRAVPYDFEVEEFDVEGFQVLVPETTKPAAATSKKSVVDSEEKALDVDESNEAEEEEEEHDDDDDNEEAFVVATKRTKRATNKKQVVDSEDDDLDMEPVQVETKRSKRATKKLVDSDDDFDMKESEDESDEEEEFDDEEEVVVVETKPAAKKRRKPAAKKPSSKKQVDADDDDVDMEEATEEEDATERAGSSSNNNKLQDEYDKKLAKDLNATKPNNNPQAWPKFKDYVEPVGVDPTHGIVEGIVAAQVRKVGSLLQMVSQSLQQTKPDQKPLLGELQFPIRLQTACSGTDAPSIALGLIKESLDKMLPAESKGLFQYSHEMSCEIEPFKQAYIGRNFPGVPLFPDITKLTASETVLDVYGRPQTLPDGNLFVAGTSCKDFSMLKTRDRQDIEDKGTSGETFLAAVEFLEQKQPPVALFENVDNAPWDKMQEYIRGRLELSKRNDTKAIKDANKKADADKQLKFSVDENGRYIAEEVPRQVGIRAGAVVQGFVKGGCDANDVQPLKCPDTQTRKLVTLGEMAKTHKINLKADTLVMEKKARYCTKLVRLDTKEYGLPQTRNRKYLFIWRSDDPKDDLGDYFEQIMNHLKTPLLHSMDAFLLPDTHDRIRCFREALRSGPGMMVKRDRAKELDFFDWELSHVKDLTLHIAYRKKWGIAERKRWLTGWDTRGRKSLAPGTWPELFDMWNHRRLDLIDCFGSAAIRDAISRDPLHHSFTWDLSQNVTRAPFRTANVGVSGCVTPGGELLMPHKGRSLMGYEKLLLQGIPFSRLLLGPESEVQLSDLAGNAMSVSVVCAAMLAAMCAPHLRRQMEANKKSSLSDFGLSQKYDKSDGAVLAERGDLHNVDRDPNAKSLADAFVEIAKEHAHDAFTSSVLCTCESSGTTTEDPTILECRGCGFMVCHDCSGRYQTCTHTLQEVGACRGCERPDPHVFERKLRCTVPSILRLGQGWGAIKGGQVLESFAFQLQHVDRKTGHWQLTYGAWEDHGSGRQVAEIRIVLGRIGALAGNVGFGAYLRCFAPAIKHKNPKRGTIKDDARLIYYVGSSDVSSPCWEVPATAMKSSLKIVGTGEVPSQRVQAGLNELAAKALANHKPQAKFIPPCSSRNPVIKYHKKWKTWPETIKVSGDKSDKVNGIYKYAGCQHTVVLSALWCRQSTSENPALYIYFRPETVRTKFDVAVVARTPSYRDGQEICELFDWIPENALVENTHTTQATFLDWTSESNLRVDVPDPAMSMIIQRQPFHDMVCNNFDKEGPVLCEMVGLSPEVIASLLEYNNDTIEQDVTPIDLVARSGTRNAKRLSIIASPALLQFAAQGKLPLKFSEWYRLPPLEKPYGNCNAIVPPRPMEKWKENNDKIERYYDAEESNDYYQNLLNRPTAFSVSVVKSEGKLCVRMNPAVAAHQAAAALGGASEVYYSLAELSSMGEPDTREFHVPNSDGYRETKVEGLAYPLYPRQAKALTRMLAIENKEVNFTEEERAEHSLPGIGWCGQAKAQRQTPLAGGVLGDAIGSGKTVVTLALIFSTRTQARENLDIEKGRSGATLIVVPPGLLSQWDDERRKFFGNKLTVIVIDSTATLKRKSVKEICSADIVLVPAGLIEEAGKATKKRPYTENLSRKSGAGFIPPAPSSYSQREAPTIEGTWVRNMASGPGIYVGNKGDQAKRDAQAYYGHCYAEAVAALREKSFGASEQGVPLEYFTWERVVIDECHETLVTGSKTETKDGNFKAAARRGAREFLGVSQTDKSKRPLLAARGFWGLTGTPLLETNARVTELANLMGGMYCCGAAHHWRKEERESGRDLFLNQFGGARSREYRCAVQAACHSYVEKACQRNRGQKLHVELHKKQYHVNMSNADGDAFLKELAKIQLNSFEVSPDQLGESAGEVLSITASSRARHAALLDTISTIHQDEPGTKIIVFANSSFGGYAGALEALKASDKPFCHVSDDLHSVQEQNEIISWFRHVDATPSDRARPRILLLSFEQAAGHNLQEACHNVILYDPMYSGPDAVADASVEEQAVGRVMRQGQKCDVTVTRIVVKGPGEERCLDDWIVERNLDEEVLNAATSNFD